MVPFERTFVTSYRLSMVTFPLSLRVSEILPLRVPARHFFPPHLQSPPISHVPLGVGGWLLGYEERRCWTNCPCSQFPRFPTYMILIRRHRETDRQTDGRHAISMPRYAQCTHCAVKTDVKNADMIRYRYYRPISSVAYLFLAMVMVKWIYIRRPYNSNVATERNGMNGMTNRLLRFTLTYKYFRK